MGPDTALEIAAAMKQEVHNIRRRLRILHKERAIYIASWERANNRLWMPVYALGKKKDAEKPPKVSAAEQRRRYRAKHGWKELARVRARRKMDEAYRLRRLANAAKWKRENREKNREMQRAYYYRHREKILSRRRRKFAERKFLESLSKSQEHRSSPVSSKSDIQMGA